jgi:hypothetical protein
MEDPKNTFIVYEDGTRWVVDLVEKSPEYLKVIKSVEEEVEKRLESEGMAERRGSCYSRWEYTKEILKAKYGIDWRDPHELNPHMMFD